MSFVRNFLSGVESAQHFDAARDAGSQHMLMSYLYVTKQPNNILAARKQQYPDIKFLIDSGAHTLQTSMHKAPYNTWTIQDLENYVADYARWVDRNRKHIFAAVELDVASSVNITLGKQWNDPYGDTVVDKWRKQIFMPLQQSGVNIIYVWHESQGFQGWEDLCATFPYVGLPGEMSGKDDFNVFMTVAKRYLTKVHGFAASVTGDSALILLRNSKVEKCSIEKLFNDCLHVAATDIKGEYIGTLPSSTYTWTLNDELKPVFAKVKHVIKHRVKKRIYKIVLRGGKTIKGTEDHSFFTLDPTGELIETKPSNMRKGDLLVASRGMPPSPKGGIETHLAEFAGVWFGDGFVGLSSYNTPNRIWVSKQQQPAIRSICDRIANESGKTFTRVSGTVDGYFCDSYLGQWLINNFGRVGEDKFIGPLVLGADIETQAAFLRGYFSADGSAKGTNRLISLNCTRRDILETVQLLLENFDIRSGITDAGISGKGGHTWELAISDLASRESFAKHIGFLQDDQTEALRAKNTDTFHEVGVHRGLPVSLRKNPWFITPQGKRMNKGFSPTRRTQATQDNFCDRLINMEAEILPIASIEIVSHEEDVYDLEVPGYERFFANGILAHNTKQADYRDWPWFSVDSITWKAGEIYGTLPVWDEKRQKLKFVAKGEREPYRHVFEDQGVNADKVITDSDYKEVTRSSLKSMVGMELFYKDRFKNRIQYYELRLPTPRKILKMPERKVVRLFTKTFQAEKCFPKHAQEKRVSKLRSYLHAISCVEYRDLSSVDTDGLAFLTEYFPSQMRAANPDSLALLKELAISVSPPNEAAKKRETEEDYESGSNPARARALDLSVLEESDDVLPEWMKFEDEDL